MVGWTVRHPRWTFAARAALTVVLAGLVTLEGVVLSRQPSLPHAVVWIAGIAVCLCLIPYRGLSLTVRGTVAATVSWVATAILVLHEHPLVVWGMGESFALLVLFSAVLRRSEAKVAALLGPMLGLAAVAAPARDADLGVFTLFFGLLTAVITTFSLVLRAEAEQRVRDVSAVRAAERAELARELHDVIAHHVTGIVVTAQAAGYAAPQGEAATRAFGRIEREAADALEAMRRLVAVMRTDPRRAAPTRPVAADGLKDVIDLADDFSKSGPPVLLSLAPDAAPGLQPDVAAAVHRIVREALTNVRKHAVDVHTVRVSVRRAGDRLELRVTDDGRPRTGPARGGSGGFGLVGMTERAEALGGHLRAGPAPEGGWHISAWLPLRPSRRETQ
ncbi:histidine kinase [Streptomyces sp. NPDC007251]|uniref:sensor histidine kinase n=1 Tax=unclassified Streptomyces TaxID=2593676 RepID=UPI00340D3F76